MSLAAAQARLVSINRQTALHRRALRLEAAEMAEGVSAPISKTQLTEDQLERIESNRREAVERKARKVRE